MMLILHAAACAHLGLGPNRSTEILEAFDAARHEVESRQGPIETIWLAAEIESEVQRVLVRKRGAVGDKQSARTVALRERHFIVDVFTLEATHGRLSGVLGPRSSPTTMRACGTGYNFKLERREGKWHAQIASMTVC